MSKNLDPSALRHAKAAWVSKVKSNREITASVSGQLALAKGSPLASIGVTWGYINHARVIQMVSPEALSDGDADLMALCVERGIVDRHGIPILAAEDSGADSYVGNSIYDCMPHGDDQRFHKLYVALVDQLVRMQPPLHLERECWKTEQIGELVQPGSLIFVQGAFNFKSASETRTNDHRRVHLKKNGVSIEFFVDSRDMFGTTSMTVSFSGRQTCAAFLQVKSLKQGREVVLSCTPIALGVAFSKRWSTNQPSKVSSTEENQSKRKPSWYTKVGMILGIPIAVGIGVNIFSALSTGSIWINPGDARPDRQIKMNIRNSFPFDAEIEHFSMAYNKYFASLTTKDLLYNPRMGLLSSDGGKSWHAPAFEYDFMPVRRAIEHNPIAANQDLKVLVPPMAPSYIEEETFAIKMTLHGRATNPVWRVVTSLCLVKSLELDKVYYFKQTNGEIAPIPESEWDYMNSEAYNSELHKVASKI
ncbi:MAG: hypothetical protein HYZ13_04100 [Acidobacteria bacterium]|nr:hypothetical protein [Acidobacteriota bacterium]